MGNDFGVRALLFLLAALGWSSWSAAQPASPAGAAPQFESIGGARPFQPEIITEVKFDRVGFLWIGTREGLYLYDGQRFRKFEHEVQNPDSISSNGIRGVFEDRRGRLWINTISGGLNLLDRATWRFRSWRHERNDPGSLIHDGVFALAQAADGKLWVGTQAGLDLFDPDSGEFTRTVLATGGEFIIDLYADREDRLWVATLGQGLFRQRADRSGFDPVRARSAAPPLDIFSLAQTADGTLWVGTRHGLYRVAADTDELRDAQLAPADVSRRLQNVTAFLPTPDGGLWIGTYGAGLYRLDAASATVSQVSLGTSPGAQHIDGGALALGPDGSLFVGTFGAGLLRARVGGVDLRTWQEHEGGPGLTYQDVYALLPAADEQGAGRLLVGSFGGGVDEIDAATGSVRHLALPKPGDIEHRFNGVTALLRARDGALWATTNAGVYRWDQANGRFKSYASEHGDGADANPGYSFALLEDRQSRIWVGGAGGGLYLYQPERDGFRNFRPIRGDAESLPDDFVTALIEDRRGRLWVGTRSGGIGICRLGADLRCRHVASGSGPAALSHDHVTSMLEAPDGDVWVGTSGGGLNRLALDGDGNVVAVRRWTRDDGLDDDNVMALAYAPDGALWLSSHGGLSRLDPRNWEPTNLTPTDGLPTAIFNPKAIALLAGRLYFGSAKGVVALDPAQAVRRGPAPATVIEAVAGLDPAHWPDRPAWQLEALGVPWRMPFSLDLAVLGYDGGAPRFQYRLAATDEWTDLGDRGQLTLHALAPGHHRVEVRGRLGGYGWTFARPLDVDVVPPWWRRTGVQASGIALLLALVVGSAWWRVRELEARNDQLQRAHGLREQALAEAHVSQARLEDAFAMLRRTTMRLEAAKERERRHLARELHDEFGQALTSAKINLGLTLASAPNADGNARVRDTIALVDRLIGQVRALSLDLRPPLLDEMGLVPALESYLHGVAGRSGLELRTHIDPQVGRAASEHEITVFRIVQEAVTNVVRHARATQLEVDLNAQGDAIAIRVHDNGIGFDAAAALAADGSGLGLFGMRERAHDLGGEWMVESVPGQGTTVTARIPRGRRLEA